MDSIFYQLTNECNYPVTFEVEECSLDTQIDSDEIIFYADIQSATC